MVKKKATTATLDGFLDRTVGFCGVDGNTLCIELDGRRVAFEAQEDDTDGYRSMLADVVQVPLKGHTFFRTAIARLQVRRDDELEGYRLVDPTTGHVWLRLGTDRSDDCYPCFTFRYDPPREDATPRPRKELTKAGLKERCIPLLPSSDWAVAYFEEGDSVFCRRSSRHFEEVLALRLGRNPLTGDVGVFWSSVSHKVR